MTLLMSAHAIPPRKTSMECSLGAARLRGLALLLLLVPPLLAGCAGNQPYNIPFMPPPAFLEDEEVATFTHTGPVTATADPRILYATVRQPASEVSQDRFYTPERATELRLGSGRIVLGRSDISWDEARKMSILKNSTTDYPLQVADLEEFGILDRSLHPLLDPAAASTPDPAPRQRFVAAINERLARSKDQDIFIYVHGYKVNFENPLLVSAELWHFLGYEGVFIPFAWPSHQGRLAYFGDTESARYSALFLRDFIEFLAEETTVKRIHIVGYSAGTRLVGAALHQLALKNQHRSTEEISQSLRLGNVILVGSDIDTGLFSMYLVDGLLRVPGHLSIYESPKDKALGMALLAFGNQRIGQLDPANLTPGMRAFIRESDELSLISVASAAGFDSGNGHSYFRDSPLVSSDLLATLRYDLAPAERGLTQNPATGIWEFPADYLSRLQNAIFSANPELARRDSELPAGTER